jgi:hypothetical protein
MTHEGEFSDPLLQLIELMTMKGFKPHAKRLKAELPDGDSIAFKTAKYRTNFKDALMCGSTKGLGSILLAAGKPPQALSIAEAQKAPPVEHWQQDVSAVDPFTISQETHSSLPSESARSLEVPTRAPVLRHTTPAELSLSPVLRRTNSAPGNWPIAASSSSSSSGTRGCNHALGARSMSHV